MIEKGKEVLSRLLKNNCKLLPYTDHDVFFSRVNWKPEKRVTGWWRCGVVKLLNCKKDKTKTFRIHEGGRNITGTPEVRIQVQTCFL